MGSCSRCRRLLASSSGEGTRWKICSGGEDRPGRPSGPGPRGQPEELRWGRPSSESQREREKGNRTVLEEPGDQVTKRPRCQCSQGRKVLEGHKTRSLCPWVCSRLSPSAWFPGPATPLIKGHWVHTWWLGDNYHIAGQPDIAGSSALKWDG